MIELKYYGDSLEPVRKIADCGCSDELGALALDVVDWLEQFVKTETNQDGEQDNRAFVCGFREVFDKHIQTLTYRTLPTVEPDVLSDAELAGEMGQIDDDPPKPNPFP